MDIMDRFYKTGVVPVVVINDANDALTTADALLAGGIDIMEVTLRTSAGLDSIRLIAENRQQMLIGAGTVVTLKQCVEAVQAGAKFIVAPGFDAEVVSYCVDHSIPVLPGCVTPTEIMAAMKLGLKTFKFFPAGVYGGLEAMKALSGPFGGIRFVPTGGVNGENMQEYIEAPFIYAVGGSWMCTAKDIANHEWAKITELSRKATGIVCDARRTL